MKKMFSIGSSLLLFIFTLGITGCAEKNPEQMNFTKLAEYSDRLGQANVKLYMYSGDVEEEDIKTYIETLGCQMLHAYFYPDSVPLHAIPVEEVRSAGSYAEVQEALYNGEGFERWRFCAQCFAVIPIVSDCFESRVSQNCR